MLIITGSGRSGTSAIAKWMSECDLITYDSEWIPQFYSGYEPKDVSRLNSAIWLGNDAPLQSLQAQEEMIKSFDYKIIKENSFFYGNVLSTWLSHRDDFKFLICLRNFHQVEKSRRRVNQLNKIKTPEEMKTRFGTFLSELVFKNIDFEIVKFPDFIDEHEKVYNKVKNLGEEYLVKSNGDMLSFEESKNIWNKVMDKNIIEY
jgi:hypothetical protein